MGENQRKTNRALSRLTCGHTHDMLTIEVIPGPGSLGGRWGRLLPSQTSHRSWEVIAPWRGPKEHFLKKGTQKVAFPSFQTFTKSRSNSMLENSLAWSSIPRIFCVMINLLDVASHSRVLKQSKTVLPLTADFRRGLSNLETIISKSVKYASSVSTNSSSTFRRNLSIRSFWSQKRPVSSLVA